MSLGRRRVDGLSLEQKYKGGEYWITVNARRLKGVFGRRLFVLVQYTIHCFGFQN